MELTPRELVEDASKKTGMSVEEIADRLDYKSLRRAMSGEIPLPESKRNHIQDLVRIAEVYGPRNVNQPTPEIDQRQRLENLVAASGLSNEEFAKKVKESLDDFELMLKGKKEIPKKVLSKAKYIAANPPHAKPIFLARTRSSINEPFIMKIRDISVIGWAQAGELTTYEDIVEYEKKVQWLIEDPNAFAIRIRGDSMNPPHQDGTTAIVTPGIAPRNEQLVIAHLKDEGVVFKKLQIVDQQNKIFRLISYNKNYDPIERKGEDFLWIYPVRITFNEH